MKLDRWETLISDAPGLRFVELQDSGEGSAIVESSDGQRFEILLDEWCGPYVLLSEEYLVKYWSIKPKGIGWTFKVSPATSDLMRCYPDSADEQGFQHYVVSSEDSCLEILARRTPPIRRLNSR